MKWPRASVIVLVFLLSGCKAHKLQPQIHLYKDETPMQQEILKFVPLGTHADAAKKIMELEGFRCTFEVTKASGPNDTTLFCEKRFDPAASLSVWAIMQIYKPDQTVSDVHVQIQG